MSKRKLYPHQEEAVEWFLRTEHETERGGILADEMGLGKTTSALTAFHSDFAEGIPPTLIVVPKAVLTQWQTEIAAVLGDDFPVLTFTDTSRFKRDEERKLIPLTPHDIARYPLVITTHNQTGWTKRSRWREHPYPLRHVQWRRIIVDEAHNLKSPKSRISTNLSA